MTKILSLLLLSVSMSFAMPVQAQQQDLPNHFRAVLSGPAEAPPNDAYGYGLLEIIVDRVNYTMNLSLQFTDLTGPATQAHVHCCTPEPLMGTAPPATMVPSLPNFPGTVSGYYAILLNLNDASTYNPAFIASFGGSVTAARDGLLSGMLANRSYFNLHTSTYPMGELRGFIVAVPEPSTWLMLGLGLLAVGAYARRLQG